MEDNVHSPQSNFKGALKRSFITPSLPSGVSRVVAGSSARNVQVKQLDSAVYPNNTREYLATQRL